MNLVYILLTNFLNSYFDIIVTSTPSSFKWTFILDLRLIVFFLVPVPVAAWF